MESYQERIKRQSAEAKAKHDAAEALFWPKLAEALVAHGHTVEWRETSAFGKPLGKRVIDKIDDTKTLSFHVTAEKSKLRYGEEPSGKIKFVIGSYGPNKKQFFQSQARGGDFDYNAIVAEIERRITRAQVSAEKDQRDAKALREGREMRERLAKDFFDTPGTVKEWPNDNYRGEPQEYLTVPENSPITLKETTAGGLKFSIEEPITDEGKLRELLDTCRKIGLIG